MTRNLYESVLRFYPAVYRETFGKEMVETYQRVAAESEQRGLPAKLLFSVREFFGLTAGIVAEWTARLVTPETYVTSRCQVRSATELPPHIVEVRCEIDRLIRLMEFAIAHHDFPKARLYSDQERATRRKLERLMSEYEVASNTASV